MDVSIAPLAESMRLGSDIEDVIGFVRNRNGIREPLAAAGEITARKALDAVRVALEPYQLPEGVLLESAAWLVTAHRP